MRSSIPQRSLQGRTEWPLSRCVAMIREIHASTSMGKSMAFGQRSRSYTMLVSQIALVSEISDISASELTSVAAALQKQAMRDFSPIWGVPGTVDAFTRLEDVPIGYWPIIVRKDIQTPNAGGVHLDKQGQPYALVQYSESWSLTVSHECLEMLVDPFGNRLIAGQSPMENQGRVEYLVEACDPCEHASFAYSVNGVLVSDF